MVLFVCRTIFLPVLILYERSPRIVRFIAEEDIETYTIIQLTEQIEEGKDETNVVPTFKAKPATGTVGVLFYTSATFAKTGDAGIAYSITDLPVADATAEKLPKW